MTQTGSTPAPADPDKDPILYITVLPNGIRDHKLQVTLLFTPSLGTVDFENSPFVHWTTDSKYLTEKWTVNCLDPNGAVLTPPAAFLATYADGSLPDHLKPAMWDALFDSKALEATKTKSRRSETQVKAWRVAHDAAFIQSALNAHRLDHFRANYMKANATRLSPEATTAQSLADNVASQYQAIDVYLRPILQADPNAPSMEQMITARDDAGNFWPEQEAATGLSQNDLAIIDKRIEQARKLLEEGEGEQLRELGLYAVYRHCVRSVLRRVPDPNPNDSQVAAALQKISDRATAASLPVSGGPAIPNPCAVTPLALDQAERTIEFLLFSRRQPKTTDPCPQPVANDPPDFHQTLGLINRYPALLRPLGLAIDLEFPANTTVPSTGTLQAVIPAGAESSVAAICFQTSYRYTGTDFYALSRFDAKSAAQQAVASDGEKFLFERFLWLGATSNNPGHGNLFTSVSHDIDGTLYKVTAASGSNARAQEYAPTPDPSKPADLPPLPSSRTTGISLLHSGRADRLQTAITNQPDPKKPLFADDLILGYRVDAKRVSQPNESDWFALCARESKYKVLGTSPFDWVPGTNSEKAADEGFVTLGAVTNDDTDANTSQILFHQSVFTWNGWNLSVPPPFDVFTGAVTAKTGEGRVLKVDPVYALDKSRKLLPLRFDTDYAFRCRAVDLAGNSVPCPPVPSTGRAGADTTPGDAILTHRMDRQEPLRPPQILLDAPIHRLSTPGDHIDVIVLRDGSGLAERIFVSPREPLRLAELHGVLKNHDYPSSAFPKIYLNEDGCFPTVQDAYEEGWFEPEEGDRITKPNDPSPPELQDSVLRLDKNVAAPECPYFPDPLARFACVNVSGDALKPSDAGNYYLDFYPAILTDGWPDTQPGRLRVVPARADEPATVATASLPLDWEATSTRRISGLVISLPPARMVTLELSSAWAPPDGTPQNRISSTGLAPRGKASEVALFRLHQQDLLRVTPEGKSQQLLRPSPVLRPASGTPLAMPVLASGSYSAEQAQTPAAQGPSAVQTYFLSVAKLQADSFLDGTIPSQTPPHRITVVHAVRRPMSAPKFPDDFAATRSIGEAVAAIGGGQITADWNSTGKITCRASWSDCIDDPSQPCPATISHHEVAFDLLQSEDLSTKKHQFRDTRAHKVIYSLTAATAFRNFYPPAQLNADEEPADPTSFEHADHPTKEVTVYSSVRPPAPVIAYIIPAFQWAEDFDKKTGIHGRIRVTFLRVYVERPFGISGDDERIGIVLAHSADSSKSVDANAAPFVSRIGLDPISAPAVVLPQAEITPGMFEPDQTPVTCYLAECKSLPGVAQSAPGAVDVLSFPVQFAPERNLWFTDIRLRPVTKDTNGLKPKLAHSPFVRLALVRYQPQALSGSNADSDARISPVVLSEFMQLASNRWCRMQKDGKTVTLTLSGASNRARNAQAEPSPAKSKSNGSSSYESSLIVELQHSWHSVDEELSWRPVAEGDYSVTVHPVEAFDTGVTVRKITVALPHSPSFFKYRILLTEEETFDADDGSSGTKSINRMSYFDFIEM